MDDQIVRIKELEQERDRLAEKVRELEGELPGKLKGERALADEQIRCFHEQAINVEQECDRLRAELIVWKHSAKSQDALADENERLREQYNKVLGAISVTEMHATINRLRGLIEALPAMTHAQLGAAIEALFEESWPSSFSTALAALLKARQEMKP